MYHIIIVEIADRHFNNLMRKEENTMALIKCPDCGKEFSDLAPACPNCGRPNQVQPQRPTGPAMANRANTPGPTVVQNNNGIPQSTKKKGSGCLITVLVFLFVAFIIGTFAAKGTSKSNSETGEAIISTEAETGSSVVDNREAALEADKQISDLVQSAESDYNVLVNLISSGSASDLDLYDTAKKVYSNLGTYQVNVSRIKCDGVEDYSNAASSYIINMQLTASYVKKYVDKQKMEDLSSAKECIANMDNYVLNLVSKKMEFLKNSGYTDEEVATILSQMGEAETDDTSE